MSSPNNNRTRSSVLEALRRASSTFAGHRAQVMLMRSVKFVIGAFLLLCVADAAIHFGAGTRFGLILIVGLAILALGIAAILIASLARPNSEKIAQLLEQRNLGFGSKLTNILELHEQAEDQNIDPLTRELAELAVSNATQQVDTEEVLTTAKSPHRRHEFKWAAIALFIFALLPLLLGEPGRRQFLRLLHPFGDHPPLSFTWLDISKPFTDQVEVVYGESARVEVKAKGHLPKEVILLAQPQDGSSPEREIPMSTRGDGLFIAELDNVTQALRLTAVTPNKRSQSKQRLIAVLLNPRIEEAWVTVTPPTYTGLPSREKPFLFDGVQALQGSQLTFRLRSNRPLGKGTLAAKLTDAPPIEVPLAPVKGDGKVHDALATFEVSHSGRLHFAIRDEGGRPAEDEATSSLTVSHDLPPDISFLTPAEDSFIVDTHEFEIEIAASDDYGLRAIRLLPAIGDHHLEAITETYEGIGPKRKNFTANISLQAMGAVPGDTVTLFAETIDNCPDPHLTRTKTRHLQVISEEQYQEFLRKQADVAQIAGAYEQLLDRLDSAMARQKELAEQLEELEKKAQERELTATEKKKLAQLQDQQKDLNEELRALAQDMKDMSEQTQVYDFEEQLHERLAEMAADIEDSVQKTEQQESSANGHSNAPTAADSAQAAREQHDRLARNKEIGDERVRQHLEDLATMHELIKDINEFKALYQEQKDLAEQTARFEQQQELATADRMSLQEMAGRQRDIAKRLQDLEENLKRHADLAEEKFPRSAQSARDLAQAIGEDNLPGLGRDSSQSMLQGDGPSSHSRATNLEEEMAKYISQCQSCQGQEKSELDQYLSLSMGSPPANNFQQMMDSLCFNPGTFGGSGMGQGGSFATGTMSGQQMGLMGSRSLLYGRIGRMLQKGKGPRGQFGTPSEGIAKVEQNRAENGEQDSTRQTSTPETQALLLEYEDLTEAYFRNLTKTPPSN